MNMPNAVQPEMHATSRIGWLRAAVLGANDGIVSTASLIAGVAAASAGRSEVMVAGIAGLVAGAMSMAAGEYVSVSSQADAENADLARETKELAEVPERELDELVGIYKARGLDDDLARQVAVKLTEHDALRTHAREELGISPHTMANPIQAAFSSAGSFAIGAALPLLVAWMVPEKQIAILVSAASIIFLALLGMVSSKAGGSPVVKPTLRVTFWGAIAMAATWAIGSLFGTTVG